MDKTAALERLTKLESEAAELRKIIERPDVAGLWGPDIGGEYFVIDSGGCVFESRSNGFEQSEERIAHGNSFRTEAIARKASALQREFNFYLRACFQADPDAGEWSKERDYGVYRGVGRKWTTIAAGYPTDSVCVHTLEQAIEACRLLNAWQAKEDAL